MMLDLPAAPPSTAALMDIARRPEAVFTHGRGSWLWDSEGRRYLDLVQGWAVNTLGHAPPELAQALAAQASACCSPGPACTTTARSNWPPA
jgi:acetylornithine/N-succinyldiaminopimelate aminotransferase